MTTTDGATLSGFATLEDALAYDYDAPLRWFPRAIAVTETDDGSGVPEAGVRAARLGEQRPARSRRARARLLRRSTRSPTRRTWTSAARSPRCAYFDGDPFPADDQLADGEATLHDRALAMLRVAIVDLDRLHADPASGVLVDDVTMHGTTPSRGTTVSTTSVAYAILALRTALRALSSQLELYSNNTPDTAHRDDAARRAAR